MHEYDFPNGIKGENQEDSMQICNATHDGQLDLLDCRATILGFDVYGIESEKNVRRAAASLFRLQLPKRLRDRSETRS
jgi:hypothetical protein